MVSNQTHRLEHIVNKTLLIPLMLLVLVSGVGIWFLFSGSGSSLKDFELDKDKQEFIWDAEHVTFEIENYFGKPLAAAIVTADNEAIGALVHNDLIAEVPSSTTGEQREIGEFTEQTWSGPNPIQTDVNGLLDFLNRHLEVFATITRAKTRVLHITAVDGQPNTWDTELLLTVHGENEAKKSAKLTSHHQVRFQYEDDEQIHDGGAATAWKTTDLTMVQAKQSLMKEITTESGLRKISLPDNWKLPLSETSQFHFQIAVEDFDRDGDLDIAVASYNGVPFLLCAEKGGFVDRSREMGLQTWNPSGITKSALAGWVDIDNDNFPDLILGQQMYKNIGGLRFKDITRESGFSAGFDPHGMSVADYNLDGLLDIYVARSHDFGQIVDRAGWVGDEEGGAPNTLWKNLGNGKFADVTMESNAGGGARTSFTSSWLYFDDDHYPDLYVANDFAKNLVLRNQGDGTFEDISEVCGAADFATSMGVATGDLDNDGTTEIYVANMYSKMGRRIISHVGDEDYPKDIFPQIQGSCAGNRLYRKTDGDNRYVDVTDQAGVNEVGWAFAPIMCDFNGDGLLDLYATTGFMSFDREKPDG